MLPSKLIEKEENWTKGSSARRPDDFVCSAHDPAAVKWCMLGAVARCTEHSLQFFEYIKILNDILNTQTIEWFNDHKDTTHTQVLDVMRTADQRFLETHPDAA